ncbi:MAG: HAMP domain-containing histidine kinase [Bacteriovoracaceae bacterium]|nr:HAMP domain-containing histidine kinase [Bacteriovoracaceae bacterium]
MDLILFTVCLLLSGGSNNPLDAVYYVIAVIGGIFTVGSGGMFFGLLISCILLIQIYPIFITSYALDMMFNLQTLPYLASQILIPAGTYLIAHSFGELLVKSQNSLIHITIQSERLDRLRALGALSSGFSHEFASPLHAAKIRLQRLGRQTPNPSNDLKECMLALDECEMVLKRMNSSQLSMDDSDLEVLGLDLLIKETSSKWKKEFPSVRLHLSMVEAKIRANRINLTQTILNLLDNAAESMEFKGSILMQLETDEHHVMVSIQDEGAGFTTDVLGRLGEPFNTNKENGTGLGLYSSLLFMHAVAGELTVFNNPDKGATIKMLFPKGVEA